MADEAFIDVLVRRQPKIVPGEPQAYKRAVIRMTLEAVAGRRAALDEMARLGQEIESEGG